MYKKLVILFCVVAFLLLSLKILLPRTYSVFNEKQSRPPYDSIGLVTYPSEGFKDYCYGYSVVKSCEDFSTLWKRCYRKCYGIVKTQNDNFLNTAIKILF